jgi:hypothetical protein
MPSAHAAVKHELLVRYLDAWAPAALHGHRGATYVDCSDSGASAVAAARVFAEFPELLGKHSLTMVVTEPTAELTEAVRSVQGLVVHPTSSVAFGLESVSAAATATFAWLDSAACADDAALVTALPHAEVVVTGPPAALPRLVCRVELVDKAGIGEHLAFSTASEKSLERFKDELWRLDEYAGIRFRDPVDAEGTLLDISDNPNVAPLRRALLGRLESGGDATMSVLRQFTLHHTIYRAADATRAVQALLTAKVAHREPDKGRLTADTLIASTAVASAS